MIDWPIVSLADLSGTPRLVSKMFLIWISSLTGTCGCVIQSLWKQEQSLTLFKINSQLWRKISLSTSLTKTVSSVSWSTTKWTKTLLSKCLFVWMNVYSQNKYMRIVQAIILPDLMLNAIVYTCSSHSWKLRIFLTRILQQGWSVTLIASQSSTKDHKQWCRLYTYSIHVQCYLFSVSYSCNRNRLITPRYR